MRRYLWIALALLLLAALPACGGGGGGGDGRPSSNWDEMNWDDGQWARLHPFHCNARG